MKKHDKKFLSLFMIVLFLCVTIFIYYIISPNTYSRLAIGTSKWDGSVADSFSGGNGTPENPFLISNGGELAYLKQLLLEDPENYQTKSYKLSSDINLNNLEFSPITNFAGSFDGDGNTIANINVVGTGDYMGFFSSLESAEIKNLNIENYKLETNAPKVGTIVGHSSSTRFENITIINSEITSSNSESEIGLLAGLANQSNFNNIYMNGEIKGEENENAGVVIGNDVLGNSFNKVITNVTLNGSSHSDKYFGKSTNTHNSIYHYKDINTLENSIGSTIELDALLILLNKNTDNIKWLKYNSHIVYELPNKAVEEVKKSFAKKSPRLRATLSIHNSGIDGTTLYINDLSMDWNHYYGLNYATPNNNDTPTMANKNLYGESNLVRTQITYLGGNNNKIGTVSNTENQNTYVYYKYFPVNNNGTSDTSDDYIEIELIDNPFSNHPTNSAFNGWATSYTGATIRLDTDKYIRYAKVPVTYSGSNPSDIDITFTASWVEAKVARISDYSWTNINNQLNSDGFISFDTYDIVYDPYTFGPGYFKEAGTAAFLTNYTGYDRYGNYRTRYRCLELAGCTYYASVEGESFDLNTTYYTLDVYSGASVATPDQIGVVSHVVIRDYFRNQEMMGYFTDVSLARNQAFTNLFDANGNYIQSGTCTTYGGCTYYRLIDTPSQLDTSINYYYKVTRDTNIIVIDEDVNGSWGTSITKPVTVTSLYNGTKYNATWNFAPSNNIFVTYTRYLTCRNDTTIENVYIATSQARQNVDPSSSATEANYFYGAYNNVKLGRGITADGDNVNFIAALGGSNGTSNSTIGSSSAPTTYSFRVESGVYSTGGIFNGAYSGSGLGQSNITAYLDVTGIYGNDYDRITNNNSKLIVADSLSPTWGMYIHSRNDTDPAFVITYKSGSYGTGKYDKVSGIYVGGRSYGQQYMPRVGYIEGGYFYNVIGGPLTPQSTANVNTTFIYVKGGSIDNLNGGAGTSETYGNRIISMTGGTINYSLFGGSNAYDEEQESTAGILHGDSYIYIGGNATIGNQDNINNNSTLWNAESGSVFGNGDGNSSSSSIGSNDNAYIVIDGEATILNNVYGGGNFGAVGVATDLSNSSNNIKIIGGTINGSVYGAGNNEGSGTDTKPSVSNIEVSGGYIKGSVYGGSNVKGVLHGDSNVNIYSGTIDGSVYGGGKGGYQNNQNSGTFVTGNVLVNVGEENAQSGPTINTSVYGGSAFGAVNTGTNSQTATSNTTTVNINKGTVVHNVFGGGQGNATYTPIVAGPITVNMNDGSVGSIYGANDASGIPSSSITVNLNGGTGTNVFGGGNNAGATSDTVNINGGTFTNVYGGSNQSGTVGTSNVILNGGTITAIYGGNNAGGTTSTSNVTINNNISGSVYGGNNAGGTTTTSNVTIQSGVVGSVYGGGNQATTGTSHVTVNANTTITNVYGGGNQASTETTNVDVNGGTITNLYGAGNSAGATTANTNINSGTVTNAYGGANLLGNVTTSNLVIGTTTGGAPTVVSAYGGNNAGGTTSTANVQLKNGTVGNLFGGGNEAITHYNNITITGGTATTVYGGGNRAVTNNNVTLNATNGNITGSLFGGGNIGAVNGTVTITAENTTVGGSVYGGGNQADVYGNIVVNVGGTSNITGNLFGGGNHGAVGTSSRNASSTVNIKGATVGGNVYGGCNTSVVNGHTNVKIGKIDNLSSISENNIDIHGTVFGGGEANESGSDTYDFSFISVTDGTDIIIDGTDHTGTYTFKIDGSIFGSGNAANFRGNSNVYIKKYGTRANPIVNTSIQRATKLTLDDSAIELLGAEDRTNEYSYIQYSLNRIDELVIKNNSTLLLQKNANLLKVFTSAVDSNNSEIEAVVDIDENGDYTRNVDNRLYLLAGTKLNILTSESLTDYGVVNGMTFMGMYTKSNAGTYQYGIYGPSFVNGSSADGGDIIIGNSYVLGAHLNNHDITKDGFYTNYINDEYTQVKTEYIDPTPEDSNYYMWIIGQGATEYSIDLTASKYSSLGAKELSLIDFARGDTIFNILGFNSEGLASGMQLVDPSQVPNVTRNMQIANSRLGLVVKTETSEWTKYNTTTFTGENGGSFSGDVEYQTDSQSLAPSLMFYLYHAKNISLDEELGSVVITMQALVPSNEIEYESKLITITVNIDAVQYDDGNSYDASITYSRKYEMPSSTAVNITNKSQFTAYFGLYGEATNFEELYGNNSTSYHALISTFAFPVGTKVTMIDMGQDEINPEEYYYIVNQNDYNAAVSELATNGEIEYKLNKFIKMNSIDSNNTYSDSVANRLYYDTQNNYAYEEFLFIIDLQNANISTTELQKSLLFELRNAEGRTTVSVLGIRQSAMEFSLYNQESDLALSQIITIPSEYIYSNDDTEVSYNTTVEYNETEERQTVIDTNYESASMGLNISFYDSSDTLVSSTLLEDTTVTINRYTYHTDSKGVFRIKLADKVASLNRTMVMHIGNSLPVGTYTVEYKLFASEDGLYSDGTKDTVSTYSLTLLGTENIILVNNTSNTQQIQKYTDTNRTLGYTLSYESELEKPNIRISVSKRDVTSSDSTTFTELPITDVFGNTFVNPAVYSYTPNTPEEKMITNTPQASMTLNYNILDNLPSGTYKVTFRLCNSNHIVDTVDKYFIIKKDLEE